MKYAVVASVVIFLAVSCEKPVDRYSTIQGKRLHILERGEGEPSVIFITGQNCPLEHFYTVQSQISKETKTSSYDRSGLGLSDIMDTVRTLDHAANELNTLLVHEKIKSPYILVGHSLGGLIAREFYHQFPDKVAGFVFVDVANYEVLFDSLIQKGLISDDFFGPDSLATKGEWYEMSYTKENVFWFKEPFATQLPVHLLVANGKGAGSAAFIDTKVNTFRMFNVGAPQMKTIYAEHSGHHIQRDQPELVINSIKKMLEEVRGNTQGN